MVKVELLVARTGGQNRGDVVEVTADEAQRMVAAGQAVICRAAKAERATSKRKAEKAAR